MQIDTVTANAAPQNFEGTPSMAGSRTPTVDWSGIEAKTNEYRHCLMSEMNTETFVSMHLADFPAN